MRQQPKPVQACGQVAHKSKQSHPRAEIVETETKVRSTGLTPIWVEARYPGFNASWKLSQNQEMNSNSPRVVEAPLVPVVTIL